MSKEIPLVVVEINEGVASETVIGEVECYVIDHDALDTGDGLDDYIAYLKRIPKATRDRLKEHGIDIHGYISYAKEQLIDRG